MLPPTFTIDLFLYDLCQSLGESQEQTEHNRRHFWQRIYPKVTSEQLNQFAQREKSSFSTYIELLGTDQLQPLQPPLDGYYYPVKLGDTCGLMIDCSGETDSEAWNQLPIEVKLEKTKNWIEEHRQRRPGTIGESWLIWTQLTDANQSAEDVAQAFYQAAKLMPQPDWKGDLVGQGHWRGATLFELEQPDNTLDGINRNHHVLLACFASTQSSEEVDAATQQLYRNLMRLFHYRNKVLWVYEQSRQLKRNLFNASQRIQAVVDSLSPSTAAVQVSTPSHNRDLTALQTSLTQALSISQEYGQNLSYLQEQIATIDANAQNYRDWVEALHKLDPNADVEFLDQFGTFALKNCLSQVKIDYQAFQVGLQPLANFISTVDGITEIEKAKSDRFLNRTIAIASVGISTASLAASTLGDQAEQIVKTFVSVPSTSSTPAADPPSSVLWMTVGFSFGLSLLIGIIFALITYLCLNQTGHNRDRS